MNPTPEEIAERMDLPLGQGPQDPQDRPRANFARNPDREKEDSHLGDFIEDKKAISPLEAAIRYDLQRQINGALKTLTPRKEKSCVKRFGIGEATDHTLEEVRQDFEVTRERIRDIEAKALRKLRHPSRSRKLKASSRAYERPGKSRKAPSAHARDAHRIDTSPCRNYNASFPQNRRGP